MYLLTRLATINHFQNSQSASTKNALFKISISEHCLLYTQVCSTRRRKNTMERHWWGGEVSSIYIKWLSHCKPGSRWYVNCWRDPLRVASLVMIYIFYKIKASQILKNKIYTSSVLCRLGILVFSGYWGNELANSCKDCLLQ